MNTLRCFIAIELSPDIRRSLGALSRRLQDIPGQACVRWVQPDSIHLTLEFLGELPSARVSDVSVMLDRAASAVAAFPLRLAGLGCFPDARRPRVFWVGVAQASGALARLQARVREGCAGLGLRVDDRSFSPHLTLGRVRRESEAEAATLARQILADPGQGIVGEMLVDAVHLIRSDLRPGGAIYSCLHTAALAGEG